MKKIAVFASGTGTNFEAIAENIEKGVLDDPFDLLFLQPLQDCLLVIRF